MGVHHSTSSLIHSPLYLLHGLYQNYNGNNGKQIKTLNTKGIIVPNLRDYLKGIILYRIYRIFRGFIHMFLNIFCQDIDMIFT